MNTEPEYKKKIKAIILMGETLTPESLKETAEKLLKMASERDENPKETEVVSKPVLNQPKRVKKQYVRYVRKVQSESQAYQLLRRSIKLRLKDCQRKGQFHESWVCQQYLDLRVGDYNSFTSSGLVIGGTPSLKSFKRTVK